MKRSRLLRVTVFFLRTSFNWLVETGAWMAPMFLGYLPSPPEEVAARSGPVWLAGIPPTIVEPSIDHFRLSPMEQRQWAELVKYLT